MRSHAGTKHAELLPDTDHHAASVHRECNAQADSLDRFQCHVYDNIATGSLLNTVLTLTGATTSPQNASTSPALAGGTVIYANVSLGALATSYTFKVDAIGFYDA